MRPPAFAFVLVFVLVLGAARAGVAFEMTIPDEPNDTVAMDGQHVDVPEADILNLSSRVVGDIIEQRVEMKLKPAAPDDSILVRNWYANSTNGSWHTLDLEVRGDAPDPAQRFHPWIREGAFENVTQVDAQYGIENTSWVFRFNASLVANASCFDPGAFAEHTPRHGVQGLDAVYALHQRFCRQTQEPRAPTPPPIVVNVPSPSPLPEAPGSKTPTPFPAPLALAAGLLAALWIRRRP